MSAGVSLFIYRDCRGLIFAIRNASRILSISVSEYYATAFTYFFSELPRLADFPEPRKIPAVERFISISFNDGIIWIIIADFGGFIGIKRSDGVEEIFDPQPLIRPIGIFGIVVIMESMKW
ncbi:MAG: hypothetical protein ABIR47_05700 [Candidatus Kapaibacterium sp.]